MASASASGAIATCRKPPKSSPTSPPSRRHFDRAVDVSKKRLPLDRRYVCGSQIAASSISQEFFPSIKRSERRAQKIGRGSCFVFSIRFNAWLENRFVKKKNQNSPQGRDLEH